MFRKVLLLIFLLVAGLLAYALYLLFSGGTSFEEDKKYAYIRHTMESREEVLQYLVREGFTNRPRLVAKLGEYENYWNNIQPGRYEVPAGTSARKLIDILSSGKQSPVNAVFGKMRTIGDLGRVITRYIESDSATVMRFLTNKDSLKRVGMNSEDWMTFIIPNTYRLFWTSSTASVLKRLAQEKEKWWKRESRLKKADLLQLTPDNAYILASIVEEETNEAKDKPLIASVYINRLRKGMPLQADPTVRFARKDFESNRVYFKDLRTPSAYNTYLNKGLPPGPICTPQPATIDAVLNAPSTNYLYFVAKADLKGGSVFNESYSAHTRAAKVYQDSLTAWQKRKAAQQ